MMSATRWITPGLLSLALGGAAGAAEPAAGALTARQAFERLKSLAGEWQGTAMTKDGPPAAIRYEVVSNGNTVMERQFPGTSHEMISMYHLDGDQLFAVHYCAMGNQPRMRFEQGSAAELRFAFAGGTNFDPKKDMHIHSARYTFAGDDGLEAEWTVYRGETQAGANKVFLTRKK
jgi:hypothetical protein